MEPPFFSSLSNTCGYFVLSFGFLPFAVAAQLHVFALEDLFASSLSTAEREREPSTRQQLVDAFAALTTASAKEEMLRLLR